MKCPLTYLSHVHKPKDCMGEQCMWYWKCKKPDETEGVRVERDGDDYFVVEGDRNLAGGTWSSIPWDNVRRCFIR